MTFLNFSQLPESVFHLNFLLTNFSNIKQTQESLKSGFLKNEFRETNITLVNNL